MLQQDDLEPPVAAQLIRRGSDDALGAGAHLGPAAVLPARFVQPDQRADRLAVCTDAARHSRLLEAPCVASGLLAELSRPSLHPGIVRVAEVHLRRLHRRVCAQPRRPSGPGGGQQLRPPIAGVDALEDHACRFGVDRRECRRQSFGDCLLPARLGQQPDPVREAGCEKAQLVEAVGDLGEEWGDADDPLSLQHDRDPQAGIAAALLGPPGEQPGRRTEGPLAGDRQPIPRLEVGIERGDVFDDLDSRVRGTLECWRGCGHEATR